MNNQCPQCRSLWALYSSLLLEQFRLDRLHYFASINGTSTVQSLQIALHKATSAKDAARDTIREHKEMHRADYSHPCV